MHATYWICVSFRCGVEKFQLIKSFSSQKYIYIYTYIYIYIYIHIYIEIIKIYINKKKTFTRFGKL